MYTFKNLRHPLQSGATHPCPRACCLHLWLVLLARGRWFESLPHMEHPEQSVHEQRPPDSCAESPGFVPSRAPQDELVPAAANSISTYQTFNLRLSETDPSSKSIMQFTESIFHLVLHVWCEPSLWELQSGCFLPFWIFWFLFCLVGFFSLSSQMINVSHRLFFSCFSDDLIGFVRPKRTQYLVEVFESLC